MGLLEKCGAAAQRIRGELRVYELMLKDERTPRVSKIFLGLAVGYALTPIDIIPDFIPLIGHLDDAVLIPLLVWVALRSVPRAVIDDCRRAAMRAE
ncbi:MAG TPA: DUF1232 domain-containing protein [Elusimicrobiota bacterium]|nr:DUF1232 domain-containing protein [Elusimicrobiota bacterium]